MTLCVICGCVPSGTVRVDLDKDTDINIRRGQMLEIALEANPTTGYTWEMIDHDNPGILRQTGQSRYRGGSDLVGAGGIRIYGFETIKTGRAVLLFKYRRVWEKDVAPVRQYTVKVDVH